jgi:hypothetical protein
MPICLTLEPKGIFKQLSAAQFAEIEGRFVEQAIQTDQPRAQNRLDGAPSSSALQGDFAHPTNSHFGEAAD